ncbi:MAG: regulatory protein RecX, partial [Rhodothermales bacterium]
DDARLRARRFTIAYLARRARTEHEVRDALRQRDFAGEVVDHAIERLKSLNYLDDADYARRYVDSRVKAKGYGPMRLRRELQRRGVAAALIEAAIAPLEASNELEEQALAQARGRLNRLRREPDERKRRKKLSDFLLRRGFDFDTISPVVETVLREARVG